MKYKLTDGRLLLKQVISGIFLTIEILSFLLLGTLVILSIITIIQAGLLLSAKIFFSFIGIIVFIIGAISLVCSIYEWSQD